MSISLTVLFLSWESPWPAHSGAALRTLGLLNEISKVYPVELMLLTRQPLSTEQTTRLEKLAHKIIRVPLRDVAPREKLAAAGWMLRRDCPYHNAVLEASLKEHPDVRQRMINFPGVVFTSNGNWGTVVRSKRAQNWILNQCDADIEFWRVYAAQAPSAFARLAAQVNYRLAQRHFPSIYANVGRIISVCEEDRKFTQSLAPNTPIDVIENGVDCAYMVPNRVSCTDRPRLLFTGTSAGRNVTALRQFARNILPLIQQQIPDVELLVAGSFSEQAQAEFGPYTAVRFTGRVGDMRPFFNQSDVFVAPFMETHGSKLKIAEAMAMAVPIVSTPQGIRGFPLIDGLSVLIANDAQQFAAHIVTLLRNPERRLAMGQAARQVALSTIDWQILGKRLKRIIQETADQLSLERV